MAVTESFGERKLKIRIGPNGVSREYCSDVITHAHRKEYVSTHGNKKSDVNSCSLHDGAQSKKREPVTILEKPMEKRRKTDWGIKLCANMLKDLQDHRCGWAFKEPVNPVAFNIPDYFSVVKNPMDLGTIESKLEKNVYSSTGKFASDVRLTFSNCMMYNPPSSQYHVMARELNNYFENKWKLLEKKLKFESKSTPVQSVSNGNRDVAELRIRMDNKDYPSKVSSGNRRAMSVEEKQKLGKDLKDLLEGKMSDKLRTILKKYNLCSLKESIAMVIGSVDDEILWELKRATNNLLKVTDAKIEAAKGTRSSAHPPSNKAINKRIDDISGVYCSSTKVKVNSKCDLCGSLNCQCNFPSNKVQSCKNFSSETVKHPSRKGVFRTDCCLENLSASCTGRLVPDANEGWTPAIDVHMSPKKALRVAMLKTRFADIISKARHNSLLDQGDKAGNGKLQWEKYKLEKQQREEKAAQIAAAEAASRLKAQLEHKIQRERERKATRIALEQMERSVYIDDNLKFLRDLELMCRAPDFGCRSLYGNPVKPLEKLGLYLKGDLIEDGDDVEEAVASSEDGREEGEIIE